MASFCNPKKRLYFYKRLLVFYQYYTSLLIRDVQSDIRVQLPEGIAQLHHSHPLSHLLSHPQIFL